MTTYRRADEVARMGADLIAEHHHHLVDNGDVRIEYLFCDPPPKSKGETVWGRARKVTGIGAWLAAEEPPDDNDHHDPEPFFIIEIAEAVWNVLDHAGRKALLDHELCHLEVTIDDDGDAKLSLAAHDVEEFEQVIRRHGLWRDNVRRFVKVGADTGRQLSLIDRHDDEDEDEE